MFSEIERIGYEGSDLGMDVNHGGCDERIVVVNAAFKIFLVVFVVVAVIKIVCVIVVIVVVILIILLRRVTAVGHSSARV